MFGSPTYLGGYAAQVKAFIDGCSGVWMKQGWKDKLAAGFTHSQGLSGDKLATLTGFVVNTMQHGIVWVGNAGLPEGDTPDKVNRLSSFTGAMAQSGYGQAVTHPADWETATRFGTRVGETLVRWQKG